MKTNCNLNSALIMTANLENIHDIYNIFCRKNRMNADIIKYYCPIKLLQSKYIRADISHEVSTLFGITGMSYICSESPCGA